MPRMIGTIFADAETLARADAHADRMDRINEKIGDREFAGWEKKRFPGEVRWYKTPTLYGIIGRDGKPRRFEIRNGETHFARNEQ